ncbi:MAG: hypothetical protein O3A46_10880 [Candidatus Poribacteria bacterium]|nr:hypothetical protein [Candidatus Poribacteria bacterium]
MKSLNVELPDVLASELERFIHSGRFHTEQELVQYALLDFVRRNDMELAKRYQMEDIEWARQLRKKRLAGERDE